MFPDKRCNSVSLSTYKWKEKNTLKFCKLCKNEASTPPLMEIYPFGYYNTRNILNLNKDKRWEVLEYLLPLRSKPQKSIHKDTPPGSCSQGWDYGTCALCKTGPPRPPLPKRPEFLHEGKLSYVSIDIDTLREHLNISDKLFTEYFMVDETNQQKEEKEKEEKENEWVCYFMSYEHGSSESSQEKILDSMLSKKNRKGKPFLIVRLANRDCYGGRFCCFHEKKTSELMNFGGYRKTNKSRAAVTQQRRFRKMLINDIDLIENPYGKTSKGLTSTKYYKVVKIRR